MEKRIPGRNSCGGTRSGWEIGGLGGVVVENGSGWKIGSLEGVGAEKLDLDGK